MNSGLMQRHPRKNIDSTVAIYTQCTLFAAGNYAVGIKVAGQKRTESHNLTPLSPPKFYHNGGEGTRVDLCELYGCEFNYLFATPDTGQTEAERDSA